MGEGAWQCIYYTNVVRCELSQLQSSRVSNFYFSIFICSFHIFFFSFFYIFISNFLLFSFFSLVAAQIFLQVTKTFFAALNATRIDFDYIWRTATPTQTCSRA